MAQAGFAPTNRLTEMVLSHLGLTTSILCHIWVMSESNTLRNLSIAV